MKQTHTVRTLTLVLALALTPSLAASQGTNTRVLRGIALVRGVPAEGVNVFDMETLEGTVTKTDGRFAIAVRDTVRTSIHIVARRIGSSPLDTTILLGTVDSVVLELRDWMILMPISVQAGRYTAAAERTATLTPLEVASTPGSNADITGAIKTLPGVQNVDEGTGLFVRGGDFTETRSFVDGAPLFTAYQFEAPTGSVAGTINPFLTNSITFSSGGFGAQWGNALSAVVDLRTQNRTARSFVNLNASILNVTLGGGLALPHNIGISATLGASDLRNMLALNGNPRDYSPAPHGRTASALAAWDYSRVGSLRIFGLIQKNGFGVAVADPSFTTTFLSDRSSHILVASWRDSLGIARPFASASASGFSREESRGVYDQRTALRSTQFRLELPFVFSDRFTMTAGGEVEHLTAKYSGSFPANAYDVSPDAPTVTASLDNAANRDAAFLSFDTRPTRSTQLILGLRSDHSAFATSRATDPRMSFAWMPRYLLTFIASWGVYHQVADPAFLDRLQNGDGLPELRSEMAIAGVQLGEGMKLLRLEMWSKRYHDLVGLTRSYTTASGLEGHARGLDFFARSIMPGEINTRLTYSGSLSRRTDPNTRIDAPASFDVTHTLTLVAQKAWASGWSTGAAYKYASGKPYTMVVGAELDNDRQVYVPEFGSPFAERMPDFTRVDLSLSKARPFGADRFGVVFVGINNVFNQGNTFGYTWSQDYSVRIPIRSAVNRTFFIGANLVLMAKS